MDVFLLALLLLCVIGARIAHKGEIFNEKSLAPDQTNAIRGFLCVLVFLVHCFRLTARGYSAAVLIRVGPYVVLAPFYLFSAYGLLASYIKNGCSLKGFWKKRLISTILPYLLFSIAAIIIRLAFAEKLTLKEILLSFVNGHPLVLYSWFIITIIAFYVVFYFAAFLAKKDIHLLIALTGVVLFFFVFAMQKLGFEDFWYNAAWAFPLGLLWHQIHVKVAEAFRRHPWVYLLITGAIALWWLIIAEYFFWFGYLARLCSTIAMGIFILMLMFKLKIGNPVLQFLGKRSLGIYMGHGLLVTAFTHFLSPAKQPYLFVALLLAGSILLAWLFDLAYGGVQKLLFNKTSK